MCGSSLGFLYVPLSILDMVSCPALCNGKSCHPGSVLCGILLPYLPPPAPPILILPASSRVLPSTMCIHYAVRCVLRALAAPTACSNSNLRLAACVAKRLTSSPSPLYCDARLPTFDYPQRLYPPGANSPHHPWPQPVPCCNYYLPFSPVPYASTRYMPCFTRRMLCRHV